MAYSLGCLREAFDWSELCKLVSPIRNVSLGSFAASRSEGRRKPGPDLRNLLLRPLQISAHLARVAHAVLKALASLCKASLGLLLQVDELAVLGIELSGSADLSAIETRNRQRRDTHVCAWTAMLRSRGMGLKEFAKRSCMYSWKSRPLAEPMVS